MGFVEAIADSKKNNTSTISGPRYKEKEREKQNNHIAFYLNQLCYLKLSDYPCSSNISICFGCAQN